MLDKHVEHGKLGFLSGKLLNNYSRANPPFLAALDSRAGGLPSVLQCNSQIIMDAGIPHESTRELSYFILTLQQIDSTKARLTTMSGMEVEVVFQPNALTRGYEHVVKDLGKWARRNLGMPGRTDPGEFTQIIWKGEVLGLNQPLALFMNEGQDDMQEERERALRNCTFCYKPLREDLHEPASYPARPAPFPHCYFCNDRPAWHHGWCCPQNVASMMYRGPTHADRTRHMMSEISSNT